MGHVAAMCRQVHRVAECGGCMCNAFKRCITAWVQDYLLITLPPTPNPDPTPGPIPNQESTLGASRPDSPERPVSVQVGVGFWQLGPL